LKKADIMTLEERKLGIIKWITQIGSEKVIEKIERLKGEENWFSQLPNEVKKAIEESKAEGEEGKFMDQKAQNEKLKNLL
jgi:uncharacterized protein (UPF0335 family)